MPIDTSQITDVTTTDTFSQFRTKVNELINIVNGLPASLTGTISRLGGTVDGSSTGSVPEGVDGNLYIINSGGLAIGDYLGTGEPSALSGDISIIQSSTSASINVTSTGAANYSNLSLQSATTAGGSIQFREDFNNGMVIHYDGVDVSGSAGKLNISKLASGTETNQYSFDANGMFTSESQLHVGGALAWGGAADSPNAVAQFVGLDLGTSLNDTVNLWSSGARSSHQDGLIHSMSRSLYDGPTNWNNVLHKIQRQIDSTKTGYIGFGSHSVSGPGIGNVISLGSGTTEYMYMTPAGAVHLTGGTSISSGTMTATSGYLVIGAHSGSNIVLDENEMQGRSDAATADTLRLNIRGGHVGIGDADGTASGNYGIIWQDTNKRVGVLTNSPAKTLDVVGTFQASGDATLGGDLALTGDITTDTVITDSTSASSSTTGALKVTGGISTQENLHVGGDSAVTGDLALTGDITTDVVITDSTSTSSSTTGALKVTGGISTQENFNAGGGDNASNKTTGAIVTAGGVGIGKQLHTGTGVVLAGDGGVANVGIGTTTKHARVVINGAQSMAEQSTSQIPTTAGYGHMWVKNESPTELWFTDDAGNDFLISRGDNNVQTGYYFETSFGTIDATSGLAAVAHGLGGVPSMWQSFMECTSEDREYEVGDQVAIAGPAHGLDNRAIVTYANTTMVGYSGGTTGALPDKNTGGGAGGIVEANWKVVIKAWK